MRLEEIRANSNIRHKGLLNYFCEIKTISQIETHHTLSRSYVGYVTG